MKKIVLFFCIFSASLTSSLATTYDFSLVVNGKTLYFRYLAGGVAVTYPTTSSNNPSWSGYTQPTGTITIPASVTYNGVTWNVQRIWDHAFTGCTGITSVIIGPNVTFIGAYAFYNCIGITSIICYNSTPPGTNSYTSYPSAFYTVPTNAVVTVPCGTSGLYQNAYGWSQFSNYSEMPPDYTTSVYSQDSIMGNVIVNTCHDTITAIPNYGYHFMQWDDGNTANPRHIILTNDTTSFTASFAPNYYTISGSPDHSWKGTVLGGNTVQYLSVVSLTASPNTGYQFSHWESEESSYNNSTDNPINVTATKNISLTAVFETSQHILSVYSTDTTLGTTLGSGTYSYNSNITITAVPNTGCHFVQWNDGNTTNPRQVHISSDTSFSAEFAVSKYIIKAQSDNTSMGTVVGTDTVYYGDVVVLNAIPNEHYEFSYWRDNHWNTYYDNPLSITATEDAIYTAFFTTEQFMVITTTDGGGTTHINEPYGPSSGNYDYLQQLTLYAVPFEGVYFSHWEDGVTYNPRSVTITSDTTFMALFTTDPNVSINTTNTAQIKINTLGKSIIVFCNTTKGEIVLYDIMGRTLSIKDNKDGEVAFSVEKAGVYFVQVGNYPAKKVVVVK